MHPLVLQPPTRRSTPSLRVFVADDSQIVHRYLALSIDLIPGAVLTGRAFNASSAVAGVRAIQPDVLILDIEMPAGGGLDVLKTLRSDAVRPRIYVLTLHASPVLKRHCEALGADGFFDKENELPTLLEELTQQAARGAHRIPITAA